jgi:hypothetical protein
MWRFTYLRDVVHCKLEGKRLRNTKKTEVVDFQEARKPSLFDLASNSTCEVNIKKP